MQALSNVPPQLRHMSGSYEKAINSGVHMANAPAASAISMIARMIVQTVVWLGITGAMLFGAAGTLAWPQAWLYLIEFAVIGMASGIAIGRSDPALLAERMRSPVQREQKSWDRGLMIAMVTIWMAQYVVAGLDAVRFHTSDMPVWLNLAGAIAVAAGFYVFHVVMQTNTFAAPVVKVQTERRHHVISSGPYAIVRHPMYAGAIPLVVGGPLMLGSWYALLCALAIIAILAVRAVLEEATLRKELDGYEAYTLRVRYRLMPGIW
jgi:protein-S-isoprenylcysteine O-methyltransferase Ste14